MRPGAGLLWRTGKTDGEGGAWMGQGSRLAGAWAGMEVQVEKDVAERFWCGCVGLVTGPSRSRGVGIFVLVWWHGGIVIEHPRYTLV